VVEREQGEQEPFGAEFVDHRDRVLQRHPTPVVGEAAGPGTVDYFSSLDSTRSASGLPPV
jgi:hypothetical protein